MADGMAEGPWRERNHQPSTITINHAISHQPSAISHQP
jgi:hypothetical protein